MSFKNNLLIKSILYFIRYNTNRLINIKGESMLTYGVTDILAITENLDTKDRNTWTLW
jgi:hypothetical protein